MIKLPLQEMTLFVEVRKNSQDLQKRLKYLQKKLELDFDLDITRDAEIEIVIDPVSKSTIRGRGEGALLIDINTNGKFNMYGDFVVIDGVYNFRYGGVVQKTFNVLETVNLIIPPPVPPDI